jgi:hypothetical protein
MNCSECQELLLAQLDGETVAAGGELDRHLHDCADCRGFRATVARLDDGLRLLSPPVPPLSFAAAITGQVLAERRARLLRRRWVGVAAAAAVLVAIGLAFENDRIWKPLYSTYFGKPAVLPTTIATQPHEAVSTETPTAPSPLELVSESRSAVAALPRRVAEEASLSKWSLSMDLLPQLPQTPAEEPEAIEKAAQSLTETRQGMAVAWEAVEGPMRRATTAWSRLTPSLQKQ